MRLNLTLMAEALDLAETISRASVKAQRRSRKQYKDDQLPAVLEDVMRVMHIKLARIAKWMRPGDDYVPEFIDGGERALAQRYSGTADTRLEPADFTQVR